MKLLLQGDQKGRRGISICEADIRDILVDGVYKFKNKDKVGEDCKLLDQHRISLNKGENRGGGYTKHPHLSVEFSVKSLRFDVGKKDVSNPALLLTRDDDFISNIIYFDLDIKKVGDNDEYNEMVCMNLYQELTYLEYINDEKKRCLSKNLEYDGMVGDHYRGLLFVKYSASKRGLHIGYRIPYVMNLEDYKLYYTYLLKNLISVCPEITYLGVHDKSVQNKNALLYLTGGKDRGEIWYNDSMFFDVAELTSFDRSSLTKWTMKDSVKLKPIKSSLESVWLRCGGSNFEFEYVKGGNHNILGIFILRSKSQGWLDNEIVDFLETRLESVWNSSAPFKEKEIVKEKVFRLLKYSPAKVEAVKDDTNSVFIQGKFVKDNFERLLCKSGFKFYCSNDNGGNIANNILVYKEGLELISMPNELNLLFRTQLWIDFLHSLDIVDDAQISQVNKYVKTNIFTSNLEIIKHEDLLQDTNSVCYLFCENGPIEITKDNHRLIQNSTKLYLRSWKAKKWSKINSSWGGIRYDKTLDLSNFMETSIFEFLLGEDAFKLKRSVGYMLHRFKNKNSNVMYIDSFDNQDGGSAGKTLSSYLVCPFRFCSIIEQPDTSSQFWLSELQIMSDILILNEAPKNFSLEKLRSTRDMSLQIERKGESRLNLGSLTPRVNINTNFDLMPSLYADERRLVSIRFEKRIEPKAMEKKYGHTWFLDEHSDEWWSYYLLMGIDCIQSYLRNKDIDFVVDKKVVAERKLENMYQFNNVEYDAYNSLYEYSLSRIGQLINITDAMETLNLTGNINVSKYYTFINYRMAMDSSIVFEKVRNSKKRGYILKQNKKSIFD